MKSIRSASSCVLVAFALIAWQSNAVAATARFAKIARYESGGQYATSFAVGDVNGDGKPDLVVANQCAANPFCSPNYPAPVGVLLNHGDGTFQPAVNYDSGQLRYWATAVAIGDVNGDGKPDIALTLNCKCDGPGGLVSVLLGNGGGTFQPAVLYDSGGFFPSAIVVSDLNGDGRMDLVVAQCQSDYVGNCLGHGEATVLMGKSDGTLRPAVSYNSGGDDLFTAAVAVGDVNGDGVPDLVLANTYGFDGISVLIGKGDGTFKPAVLYDGGFAGLNVFSVAIGDVNGDGHPDVVVANGCQRNVQCNNGVGPGAVNVVLGKGDGTFLPGVEYASGGSRADSIALADVNGDGRLDVVVSDLCAGLTRCFNHRPGGVSVLLGNGDGTLQTAVHHSSGGKNAMALAVVDVNADGKPDVLVTNVCPPSQCGAGTVGVLLNTSRNPAP